MASEKKSKANILSNFSDHRQLIRHLYEENESFHSLYDDYLACRLFMKKINSNKIPGMQNYKNEYEDLLRELAEEIEMMLHLHNDKRATV